MEGAESGIGMEVWTDLPGMQFYTANFVEHEEGKEGICYGKRSGACFETQYFRMRSTKSTLKVQSAKPAAHIIQQRHIILQ